MIGAGGGALTPHWAPLLLAAAAGVVIALTYLAADYLIVPALRLRAARRRGPDAVENLMDRERLRLNRLRNEAAVREEHGDPDATPLRDEAELRSLVVGVMESKIHRS